MPRWLSASVRTSGTRRMTAARPTGPATYPPPPRTASGRSSASIRRARTTAPAASAHARAAFNGFVRLSPATRIVRSSKPAAGTSSASARSPPTQTTSAPAAFSRSATASAGTT